MPRQITSPSSFSRRSDFNNTINNNNDTSSIINPLEAIVVDLETFSYLRGEPPPLQQASEATATSTTTTTTISEINDAISLENFIDNTSAKIRKVEEETTVTGTAANTKIVDRSSSIIFNNVEESNNKRFRFSNENNNVENASAAAATTASHENENDEAIDVAVVSDQNNNSNNNSNDDDEEEMVHETGFVISSNDTTDADLKELWRMRLESMIAVKMREEGIAENVIDRFLTKPRNVTNLLILLKSFEIERCFELNHNFSTDKKLYMIAKTVHDLIEETPFLRDLLSNSHVVHILKTIVKDRENSRITSQAMLTIASMSSEQILAFDFEEEQINIGVMAEQCLVGAGCDLIKQCVRWVIGRYSSTERITRSFKRKR